MNFKEIEKELLNNKSFKRYFEENKLSHDIAVFIMKARISKGLSQEALAKKIGTKQSGIARLERGASLPSLRFLEKIAKTLSLNIEIWFQEKNEPATFTKELSESKTLFSTFCDISYGPINNAKKNNIFII